MLITWAAPSAKETTKYIVCRTPKKTNKHRLLQIQIAFFDEAINFKYCSCVKMFHGPESAVTFSRDVMSDSFISHNGHGCILWFQCRMRAANKYAGQSAVISTTQITKPRSLPAKTPAAAAARFTHTAKSSGYKVHHPRQPHWQKSALPELWNWMINIRNERNTKSTKHEIQNYTRVGRLASVGSFKAEANRNSNLEKIMHQPILQLPKCNAKLLMIKFTNSLWVRIFLM